MPTAEKWTLYAPTKLTKFREHIERLVFKYQRLSSLPLSRIDPKLLTEVITNFEDFLTLSENTGLEMRRLIRSLNNTIIAIGIAHNTTSAALEGVSKAPQPGFLRVYLPESWRSRSPTLVYLAKRLHKNIDSTYDFLTELTFVIEAIAVPLTTVIRL